MSSDFYHEYKTAVYLENSEELFPENDLEGNLRMYIHLSERREKAFAGAVVFQAMAIEAYVNLMGAYLTDEKTYYEKYERKTLRKKIDYISGYIGKEIPESLRNRIYAFFKKRNKLVHQKPRFYPWDFAGDSFETLKQTAETIKAETSFYAGELSDEEMSLYNELKEAVKRIRGSEQELIDEIRAQT